MMPRSPRAGSSARSRTARSTRPKNGGHEGTSLHRAADEALARARGAGWHLLSVERSCRRWPDGCTVSSSATARSRRPRARRRRRLSVSTSHRGRSEMSGPEQQCWSPRRRYCSLHELERRNPGRTTEKPSTSGGSRSSYTIPATANASRKRATNRLCFPLGVCAPA